MTRAGSQSRYEVQKYDLLWNPTGLHANMNNGFGIVDSSDRISNLKSKSHINRTATLDQPTLASQPLLVENYWGAQSAMYFDGLSTYLVMNNSVFKPNWDEPFFCGLKFETTTNLVFRQPLYYRSEFLQDYKTFQINVFGVNGSLDPVKMEVMMSARIGGTKKYKVVRTISPVIVPETPVDVVFINSGTDESMDWELWINGVQEPIEVLAGFNDSFIGAASYPGLNPSVIRIGRDETGGEKFKGWRGKTIEGWGVPDVEKVRKALNGK